MTTVKLPFEIGQKVWTLSDEDKAVEFTIRNITVAVSEDNSLSYANYYNDVKVWEPTTLCRKEKQLFKTVEELKNSIFGNID